MFSNWKKLIKYYYYFIGKGVVSDDAVQCVASARTTALLDADVILLLGARLNWILHFGRPPRFSSHVKIIQVTISTLTLRFFFIGTVI